jgi:hypothetical protein
MSLKRFVLVLIILLILTLSTAIAETYYPDTYGEGETQHIWAKFKQVNGHIISTDTQTRCDLKNDSTTDGQKDCTSEFIIKNIDGTTLLSSVDINTDFTNEENINDLTYQYSDDYDIVQDFSPMSEEVYDKFSFKNYSPVPTNINSDLFAIKVSYTTPQYSTNAFNFSLDSLQGEYTIDPDVSACGTLASPGMYTLNQSVTSTATCFSVSSGNVFLDCAGHNITYGTSSYGYAFYNYGRDGVVVTNCNISQGTNASYSILNAFTQYTSYVNNNFELHIYDYSIGLYAYTSQYLNFSNNYMNNTKYRGIYLNNITHFSIDDNEIHSVNYAIYSNAGTSGEFGNNELDSTGSNDFYSINGNSTSFNYENQHGKIVWQADSLQTVWPNGLGFNSGVIQIEEGVVGLNTSAEIGNALSLTWAEIYVYNYNNTYQYFEGVKKCDFNLNYSLCYSNGVECPDCYNGNYSGTTLTFDVNGFSSGYSGYGFEGNESGNETACCTAQQNIADNIESGFMVFALCFIVMFFLYFSFQLDKEHFLLRLLLIFFSIVSLILIPNVFIIGVQGVKDNFLKIGLWFFRIFVIYFSVYLFYHWAKKTEVLKKWFKV